MALGLSIPLEAIPGVGSLLKQLDSYKAQFLAVPDRVNRALDRLSVIRQALAANKAPPSAQSDALSVEQSLRQVQSEWNASATDFAHIQSAGMNLSLDTVTTAGHLVASVSYVLGNMKTLESRVEGLASKYLTAQQVQQANAVAPASGMSPTTLVALALGAYLLLGRRRHG